MINIAVIVTKCNFHQLMLPFHFMLPIFSSELPINTKKMVKCATYIKITILPRTGRMIDHGEIVNSFHRCNFPDFRIVDKYESYNMTHTVWCFNRKPCLIYNFASTDDLVKNQWEKDALAFRYKMEFPNPVRFGHIMDYHPCNRCVLRDRKHLVLNFKRMHWRSLI